MAYLNGRQYTDFRGLNLQAGNGVLRFTAPDVVPTTTSGELLLYVSGTSLVYDNGSSITTIGASGGGGTPTWETIFAADATFTITPDSAFTIAGNRSTATDVLVITNAAGGSGSCLQITNSGSGNDVDGTSNTWSVSATGAATFLTLVLTGSTITSTTLDVAWALEDNDATALSIGASGDTNMLVFDTRNAAPTVVFNDAMTVTDGLATFISTSNTANNVLVTNNTISTFGADASSAGAVCIRSTSVTTGSLLQLQLSDTANAGGFYLCCRESVGGTNDFTIGENGVLVMAGTASNDSLTVTAGHVVVTAGNLTLSQGVVAVTSTGTADVISVTANSVLSNNLLVLNGSGTFTGTTTGSFVYLNPSGLTTGTALYIACGAATTLSTAVDVTTSTTTGTALRLTATGVETGAGSALEVIADSATTPGAVAGEGVVKVSADALTTGSALDVTCTSITLTTGRIADFSHISGSITGTLNKTADFFNVSSLRTVTTGTVADDYDMGNFIRTSVINGGGTFTATGSVLYVENAVTNTSGTVTDTVKGIEVVMDSLGTGDALEITHNATGGRAIDVVSAATSSVTAVLIAVNDLTTTGVGLSLTNTGTGLTSGSVLRVASGTTSAVATNGVVSLFATGAFTSTAVTDGFVRVNANSTLSGTAVAVNGNVLTTGVGIYVGDTGTGMTSGSLIRAVSASTGAVATNGVLSVQATGAYTSTANMGILAAIANTTTAGTVAYVSATSMIGGTLLFLNATAATLTGKYIQCYDGAADDFSVGQYGATIIAGNEGSTVVTVTAGDIIFSQGSLSVTDNDNANSVSFINDTATTIGAAANAGLVDISGDGLTTGTALNIGLTEGTLTTGRYFKCWDVTAGVEVFAIEEDGEVFVAEGRATTAGGADAINIGASAAIKVLWGSGVPTATAPQGSLYMRTDGSSTSTRAYINTDGAGTWTAITTAA